MLRILLIFVFIFATTTGCQNTAVIVRPADCARTCKGCCDVTGACLTGTEHDACGAPGDVCMACGANEFCAETRVCLPSIAQPMNDAGTPVDAGTPDAGSSVTPDAGNMMSTTCPPDGWCVESVNTTAHLRSVWARAIDDVWVAGDQGTILHFDGTSWSPTSVSGVTDDLFGIWAASANDVWAVGGTGFPTDPIGVVLHFDGISWSVRQRNLPRVDAVFGTSANDVWFAGGSGSLHRWDGTNFTSVASNTTRDIVDLAGVSPSSVWAVGSSGLILSFDGTRWTEMPTTTQSGLTSALAFDATAAVVAGGNGAFATWNGSQWTAAQVGQDVTVMGLWGSAPDSVWSVGPSGEIRHFNGTQQQLKVSNTTQFLRDVHGVDRTHAWAVGFNGTVLRYSP